MLQNSSRNVGGQAAGADEDAGKDGQRGDGGRAPVVTQGKSAMVQQPAHSALDHPAMPPEPLFALDAAAGDSGGDPAAAEVVAATPVVVALVRVQLARAASGPPRLAPTAPHRPQPVEQRSSIMLSCRLAPVTPIASGRPPASHRMWYLLPGLPRSVGFGPVSTPPFLPGRLPSRPTSSTSPAARPGPVRRAPGRAAPPRLRRSATGAAVASTSSPSRSRARPATWPSRCRW